MGFGSVRCAPPVPGDDVIRLANRGMVAFDLVLGAATIAAPDATLRVLGHERPSADARELFQSGVPRAGEGPLGRPGEPVRQVPVITLVLLGWHT